MKSRWIAGCMTLALLAAVQAQEKPAPEPQDEELSPEKAMEMLGEAHGLMEKAEELLEYSSAGKAIETEKQILERIKKLLEEEKTKDPSELQKKVLEKIQKMMKRTQGTQKNTVEKLTQIIKKVRAQQQQGSSQPQPQGQKPQQQNQKPKPQRNPGNPAVKPYDPNNTGDPINRFRSTGDRTGRWGDLPPHLREAILSGKRELDDFPPEYQQELMEYYKRLSGER